MAEAKRIINDPSKGIQEISITAMVENEEDLVRTPDGKCKFCRSEKSKYTCPKCGSGYCGLKCYKSTEHQDCSENFYKENVMAELKTMKSSDDVRKQTMELLKRQEELKAEAEDDGGLGSESLENRMRDLDLETVDAEEIWNKLTPKERRIFESSIKDGEVEIAELCIPWWIQLHRKDTEKVSEVNPDSDEQDCDTEIPNQINDLKSINEILPGKSPSPSMPYNISEVIAVYVFVYRLYNGELLESLDEVLSTVLDISWVLERNDFYEDMDSCLSSFVNKIKENASFSETVDPVEISLHDLYIILSMGGIKAVENDVPTILCISHLHELFLRRVKEIEKQKPKMTELRQKKKKYFQIMKKLHFMACWLQENHSQIAKLQASVMATRGRLSEYWKDVKKQTELIEKHIDKLRDSRKSELIEKL